MHERSDGVKKRYTPKGRKKEALLSSPLLLLALLFFFHPVEAVNGFLLAGWLSALVLLSVEPYGLLLSFRLL